MRAAVLLLILAALLIASAWNANALIDATLALYGSEPVRRLYAVMLGLFGVGALIVALVMISRSGYRQVERDFPNTWKD